MTDIQNFLKNNKHMANIIYKYFSADYFIVWFDACPEILENQELINTICMKSIRHASDNNSDNSKDNNKEAIYEIAKYINPERQNIFLTIIKAVKPSLKNNTMMVIMLRAIEVEFYDFVYQLITNTLAADFVSFTLRDEERLYAWKLLEMAISRSINTKFENLKRTEPPNSKVLVINFCEFITSTFNLGEFCLSKHNNDNSICLKRHSKHNYFVNAITSIRETGGGSNLVNLIASINGRNNFTVIFFLVWFARRFNLSFDEMVQINGNITGYISKSVFDEVKSNLDNEI